MHLQSLNHLIDVVCAVARPTRVLVLGSSSLLPGHPAIGGSGQPLELTTDADLLLEPENEAIAESLQIAAGKDSAFMAEFGYYVDILRPAIVETLPAGWETRLQPVSGYDHVFALDTYDLALVKLVLGREKDLSLLRGMLRLGIVEPEKLRRHYQATPLGEREALTAGRNLRTLLQLAAIEETGEVVVICRNGKPVAEMKPIELVQDRLTPDPTLKVTFAPGFDPREPATDEDWPEECR